MNDTSDRYTEMGMVLLAVHQITTDQEQVLGYQKGATEEGIAVCIENFSDEDLEHAWRIGRRIEEEDQ